MCCDDNIKKKTTLFFLNSPSENRCYLKVHCVGFSSIWWWSYMLWFCPHVILFICRHVNYCLFFFLYFTGYWFNSPFNCFLYKMVWMDWRFLSNFLFKPVGDYMGSLKQTRYLFSLLWANTVKIWVISHLKRQSPRRSLRLDITFKNFVVKFRCVSACFKMF